jgi:membrane associated rhomboid family serine protease
MFFIIPVGVDYRARRYPMVTFTLMGICVLIYVVTLFLKLSYGADAIDDWVFENLWLIPAEGHWWTYLTHQFVHAGFFHLLGNMIYLFLFGACCEDIIGRVHFVAFYILSGVAAALTHVLMAPGHFNSEIPMGGASGAISGCIGGFLILLAATKIEFKWVIFLWFRAWNGEFFLPAWVVISFWFLEDAVSMILRAMSHRHGGGVAFAAHVGGTLFGLGLMAVEKVRLKYYPEPEIEIEQDAVKVVTPALASHAMPAQGPVRTFRVKSASAPEEPASALLATAPVTPTAAGEVLTIHLSFGGAQSGPFSPGQIQQMFVAGEIPVEALYWQAGMDEWRNADELREPGVV